MSEQVYVDESDVELDWFEIPAREALDRLENMLSEDVVAFEIDTDIVTTPLGPMPTYTWILTTNDNDQRPVLMSVRDPVKPMASMRWFIHCDLIQDES